MFTGIIEEIGSLAAIMRRGKTLQLQITAPKIISDVKLGDSVAVNGVCLTVTAFNKTSFWADVMPITFRDSSLSSLKINGKLNLERAMAANGRFGGHIVSGHVDGVAVITKKTRLENALLYQFKIPTELAKYVITKGSVAIDGTSLTVVEASQDSLSVALIAHTQEYSLLGSHGVGARVNLECDILAKHQARLSEYAQAEGSISQSFLQQHGFI